jgi:hypothetical protein
VSVTFSLLLNASTQTPGVGPSAIWRQHLPHEAEEPEFQLPVSIHTVPPKRREAGSVRAIKPNGQEPRFQTWELCHFLVI